MSTILPILLYLGSYIGQSTQTQEGNLSQPHITALPTSMVLSKDSVTIVCQGTPEAEVYNIYKVGGHKPMDGSRLPSHKETYTLRIPELTPDWAGLYHCSYRSGGQWSPLSDPLQLVMTGAYDKPSLSSMSGTVVASGDNVKLQCFSKIRFDIFILIKEDGIHTTTQNLSSTPQGNAHQAIFKMNHVTSTQMGTYRCYGAFGNDPYVWSLPSDRLQLVVKAPAQDQTQKHQHFLIGFTVAMVLLLLLLLFFIVRHFKAKNNATRTDRQPEAAEPTDGQASQEPKEVTYSQVTCSVPTQWSAGTPSSLPRQIHISEYATLALR